MSTELSERLHFPIEDTVTSKASTNAVIGEAVADLVRRLLADPQARAETLVVRTSLDHAGYTIAGSCFKWSGR